MVQKRYAITPRDSMVPFLDRAYKTDAVRGAITERLSHGAKLTSLVPQRGHLTKDGRLMIAYRAQTFHPKLGSFEFPVFYQNLSQSHAAVLHTYKQLHRDNKEDRHNLLNRLFYRTADLEFISAFPLDPELRSPLRLLKPGELLDAYNAELRPAATEPASGIRSTLLGYRPERRVVLKLDVTCPRSRREFVLKLYRRQEAERVWQHCRSLHPHLQNVPGITAPVAYSPNFGGLLYPYRLGAALHDLMENGCATAVDFQTAGANLRILHDALPRQAQSDPHFRQFTFEDELEILNRWRRFLKHGGLKESGYLAKYIKLLEPEKMPVFEQGLIHRDYYPKQLLVHPWTREQALVDIDTMAVGPRALDVGNFVAHLHMYASDLADRVHDFRAAFLDGYGKMADDELLVFEFTSVARLFCLALVSPNPRPLADALRRIAKKLEHNLERALA